MRYSRQNKILDLISNYEIDTQEKLASMLRAKVLKLLKPLYPETSKNSAGQGSFFFRKIQICGRYS